jgi:serine/threonine protein kinase
MSRRVTCSRQHSFELPGGDGVQAPGFPILCPVCGEVVARTAEELDKLANRKDGPEPDTEPEINLPPSSAPRGGKLGLSFPADYEVVESLGQGGMGSVFKAVHKRLGRLVALKMHAPLSQEDPAHRARLCVRALAATRLDHPHLVRVFEVGEQDGWLWEAQEFMEGGDLARLLRDGPLPPARAVRLLAPIALAVQYLHEHGYIHRNLKPSKILLTADGWPKLADLDLAKRLDEDAPEQEPMETIVGTPRYMAPEQWRGDAAAIGPATDVYGLGAILYEALTGQSPFQGSSLGAIAMQTMSDEPIPPRRLRSDVPQDLEVICLRCLEKDPHWRFASAADLAEALKRLSTDVRDRPAPCAAPPTDADTGVFETPLPMAQRPIPAEALPGDFSPVPTALPTMPRPRASAGVWARLWARVRPWLRARKTARDPVDATVFAPPTVQPGQEFLVQVFAHLPTQADQARELAREFDQHTKRRGVTSLELEIARGECLTFHLTLPGLVIDPPQASLVWRGRPDSVQFGVRVPGGHSPGTVVGTATASLESVPVGHVKFKLTVAPPTWPAHPTEPAAMGESARRYRHAFISYAAADRKEVLKRVQMLARLRIRFFQDILDLDPGVRWQRELYRHIDQSDLFLLFWSTPARQSNWVLEEVRYALKRKGNDDLAPPEILPIVIEGPPPPPPPDELAHLHFNDYLLYLMQNPSGQQ